jgi:TM2 domain-containing membrane protein YozV
MPLGEQPARPSENPYRAPAPSTYTADQVIKNPANAFKLALGLGFLGIMGMGHLYMDKKLKGFLLLFVGGFLATMSLFTWLTVWDNEYSMAVNLITAIVLSVPYLVLQIWQAFDAPKPKKEWSRGK